MWIHQASVPEPLALEQLAASGTNGEKLKSLMHGTNPANPFEFLILCSWTTYKYNTIADQFKEIKLPFYLNNSQDDDDMTVHLKNPLPCQMYGFSKTSFKILDIEQLEWVEFKFNNHQSPAHWSNNYKCKSQNSDSVESNFKEMASLLYLSNIKNNFNNNYNIGNINYQNKLNLDDNYNFLLVIPNVKNNDHEKEYLRVYEFGINSGVGDTSLSNKKTSKNNCKINEIGKFYLGSITNEHEIIDNVKKWNLLFFQQIKSNFYQLLLHIESIYVPFYKSFYIIDMTIEHVDQTSNNNNNNDNNNNNNDKQIKFEINDELT